MATVSLPQATLLNGRATITLATGSLMFLPSTTINPIPMTPQTENLNFVRLQRFLHQKGYPLPPAHVSNVLAYLRIIFSASQTASALETYEPARDDLKRIATLARDLHADLSSHYSDPSNSMPE